ncbi:MAG: manganese efflux pump [Pirellulales bacterium]|nr:manganese efflux pump [Pirellulales bacterium]
MGTWELLGIAVGLAMDAFAVSVAAGVTLSNVTPRHTFRLAFHFGLFQFLMPVLGWLAGARLAGQIQAFDHWVAFGLLVFVGSKMMLGARRAEGQDDPADPTRGLMLVTLSVATSIDALAVGLSMAFLRISIWMPAVVIGLVAATLSTVGIQFGRRLGSRVGQAAELIGGGVLLAIAVRILHAHLGA